MAERAEHAGPGTLEGTGGYPGSPRPGVPPGGHANAPAAYETFHGRPSSWVAVIIVIVGFVIGGSALIAGTWWLFWVGVVISVLGGIVGLSVHVLDDWY